MVYTPTATYRLQLSPDFTLAELKEILPYLHKLGISTLYAAPIFEAREGSTHGYDVTNPYRLNPAIGSEKELKEIANWLKSKQMGWLQDIVPNHMAYSMQNGWLMDVLEKGSNSPYYSFFDFWEEVRNDEPIMTPFLGDTLENCLKNEELTLSQKEDRLYVQYYDNLYPLSLPAYTYLLEAAKDGPLKEAGQQAQKLTENYQAEKFDQFKKELTKQPSLKKHLAGFTERQEQMKELLNQQYYRLCYWKETEKKINYRRFFTVNDLICLNIHLPEVFTAYHRYIKELLDKGLLQGLRIDHIDGLYDPAAYLSELRSLIGDDTYLVIEKILEHNEVIDQEWPIQGTTGYEFLSQLNALFVNAKAKDPYSRIYQQLTEQAADFEEMVWQNKKLILHQRMQGEFNNLLSLYYSLGLNEPSLDKEKQAEALSSLLLAFPVYRTYINRFPISSTDIAVLERTFSKAAERVSQEASPALQHLKTIFHSEPYGKKDSERLLFIHRMQQISGPLEAKGLEDTTFYSYNRLSSLNEVGGQPQHFGMEVEDFHAKMKARQEKLPLTLNTTATHDTKRGEDARQRLNALSEVPEIWQARVAEWVKKNKSKKTKVKENLAPDANDEYFIYQSLLAFYSPKGTHGERFLERIKAYLQKALRESKRHSNWSTPNTAYEEATERFVEELLDDKAFMKEFLPLLKNLAPLGMFKSLSQVLIKMLAPGIPDVYQGTEFPDLSMVDPDNRRDVNYKKRIKRLDELLEDESKGRSQLHKKLLQNITDGRLKLYLTHKCLVFRRQHPDLCSKGSYIPIQVLGKQAGNILAFARQYQNHSCLVVAPLYPALIAGETANFPTETDWDDTRLQLPASAALPEEWINELSGEKHQAHQNVFAVRDLLGQLPLALLKGGKA